MTLQGSIQAFRLFLSISVLSTIIFLFRTSQVAGNRFQNGLMLGYILQMKSHGGPPPPPCSPSWDFGEHQEGLGWKLKECPENLIEKVFRKKYNLDAYEAKANVVHAKGEKKATTLLGKALKRLPRIHLHHPDHHDH